jgi:hypothetical protein
MKAQRRMKIPGRKKAREAMTVVSEQEPWTPCLRWGTIYGIPVVPLRRDPRACWVDALTIPRLPYVTTPPCSLAQTVYFGGATVMSAPRAWQLARSQRFLL